MFVTFEDTNRIFVVFIDESIFFYIYYYISQGRGTENLRLGILTP